MWYAITAPVVAHGIVARPGDYLVICPECPVLPFAHVRKGPDGWTVAPVGRVDVDALRLSLSARR